MLKICSFILQVIERKRKAEQARLQYERELEEQKSGSLYFKKCSEARSFVWCVLFLWMPTVVSDVWMGSGYSYGVVSPPVWGRVRNRNVSYRALSWKTTNTDGKFQFTMHI